MDKHFTATAVVHDEAGRALMVLHKKFSCWLCPGGHVEPGELPDEAVLREVREETGLAVTILPNGELPQLGDAHAQALRNPFCVLDEQIAPGHHHIDLVYRCLAPAGARPVHDPAESDDIRWFTAEEIAAWPAHSTFHNVREVVLESARRFAHGE